MKSMGLRIGKNSPFDYLTIWCVELGVTAGFIVTEDHEEDLQQEGVTIHCVPF